MKSPSPPIDVRRYDTVVDVLVSNPGISIPEAAERSGVSPAMVQKIWDGSISRPRAVVLERLPTPRRCPDCGGLLAEWPCVLCEIKRRREPSGRTYEPTRFVYKRQSK